MNRFVTETVSAVPSDPQVHLAYSTNSRGVQNSVCWEFCRRRRSEWVFITWQVSGAEHTSASQRGVFGHNITILDPTRNDIDPFESSKYNPAVQ